MVILGVDPGLNATGYGIIDAARGRLRLIAAGDIRPPARWPLSRRILKIYDDLARTLEAHQPQLTVLEALFTHHQYLTTAALMAHARSLALLVSAQRGMTVIEYLPTRVKKALTGYGAASKDQVARAVGAWLGLGATRTAWSWDTTDALALAIAHAHIGDVPDAVTRAGGPEHRAMAPEMAAVLARVERSRSGAA